MRDQPSVDVGAQALTFADGQELLEGARFELPDALAADAIAATDLFKGQRLVVGGAEAEAENIGLARRQLVTGRLRVAR